MKKYILLAILFGLLVVASLGCMEEPNPVGSSLLPPTDYLQLDTTTIAATGSFSTLVRPNTSGPTNILIGKTNSYEAWSVLRFTSIADTLLFTNLIDAEIQLRSVYFFGDSLAPLSFDVHEVLTSWGGDSLTIDSLQLPGFSDPVISSAFPANQVGDTATISIPLDTTLVRKWISGVLDTLNTNWGVLLKPTNAGVIKGFATSQATNADWHPKLVVRYTRPESTTVDTARLVSSVSTFTAFTSDPIPTEDESRIYVHNGIASRGAVNFDISSLPEKATIHKAVLELTLDPLASRLNSHTRDSVNVFYVDTAGVILSIVAVSEPATVSGQKVHRLSVTGALQLWTRTTSLHRLILNGYTESNTLDSFVFYGAQSNYKPRLIITYSRIQ